MQGKDGLEQRTSTMSITIPSAHHNSTDPPTEIPDCVRILFLLALLAAVFCCLVCDSLSAPRRHAASTRFRGFVLLCVLLLVADVQVASSAKLRSWRTGADMNLWNVGKPSARSGHRAVTTVDGSVWMFGGRKRPFNEPDSVHVDLIKLDLETKQWIMMMPSSGAAPNARALHAMAAVGTDVYVHGGEAGRGDVSESRGKHWELT